MTWCDKLASTPVVGLRFGLVHKSSNTILDQLRPLFDSWVDGRQPKFSIEKQSAFGLVFITDNGFRYTVDPGSVVVEFHHRWRLKPRSGSLPVAELLSQARPYSELLEEAVERLLHAVELINGPGARPMHRLGIVTDTKVVASDAPPGVRRLIAYVGRPWGGNMPYYSFDIAGTLGRSADHDDRCIHSVGMDELESNPDGLVTVRFDWQRHYTIARPLAIEAIRKQVAAGKKAALEYFEDVAEGSRFDEDILRKST